jgi:predicted acyl esterase
MLEIHSDNHVVPFYSTEGRSFQKRFLDQWLYDIDTGITREPPVKLAIRHGEETYRWRYENAWPIARTTWTPYYLHGDSHRLGLEAMTTEYASTYAADTVSPHEDSRLQFSTDLFQETTEFTGPVMLKLWISSSSDDADLIVVIRKIDTEGNEVRFPAQSGASIPAAIGWLRASHRKLDPEKSTPYRPYHTHDELQKLTPHQVVPLAIEIWPTSVVFEPGDKMVLDISSRDDPGVEPFLHNHPVDRIQGGQVTVHTGGQYDSHLLMPMIPSG